MAAFKYALDNNEFVELPPGTWVAFANQKLITTAPSGGELLEIEAVLLAEAPFIDRVNIEEIW